MAEPAQADERDKLDAPRQLDYAEFGRRFFEVAVTRERVLEAVGDLAGRPIDVGPIGVGPLKVVRVRAHGAIGQPVVEDSNGGEHVAFHLTIPAQLHLEIQIGLESYGFDADTAIHLPVIARPVEPLRIFIDVEPPTEDRIVVDLSADGVGAAVLDKLAGIEREVQRNVAKHVRKEIEKTTENRIIDVARAAG
jgi:hypothetical protein